MKKEKKKRKIRKVILFGILILDAFMIFHILGNYPVFVKIIGDRQITVEAGSVYEDLGAVSVWSGKDIRAIGTVDTGHTGTYILKYRSGLQTLKRTVNVVDSASPEIDILGRDIFVQLNEDYEIPEAVATDAYEGDLSDLITVDSYVDTGNADIYDIVYSVTDSSGNKAEKILNVYVFEDDYDYCTHISNTANADPDILSLLREFTNSYYRSLKYLQTDNFADYFVKDGSFLFEAALSSLIEYRNSLSNDLRMDRCSYSLEIKNVQRTGNGYSIDVLEDASMSFHFLDEIETETNDICITYEVMQQNGKWKIYDLYREEGVFLYFKEVYDMGLSVTSIRKDYLDLMYETDRDYESDKAKVIQGLISDPLSELSSDFDGEKAAEYARRYALSRNAMYDSFESNCVNFVSQCMVAGGLRMDSEGYEQWKYYGSVHDESDGKKGYTYSFTYIPSFIEYLYEGDIICELDSVLWFGKTGDVIAVDYEDTDLSDSPHVLIISDVIEDEDGKVLDFLICGNTNDQLDYPLSSLSYPYKKLIRIFGNR